MTVISKKQGEQIGVPGSSNNPVVYAQSLTVGSGGIANSGPVTESANIVAIGNVATYSPTAAQSGTVFLLNNATGTVVTLPAPVAGLKYDFVVTTSVTSNAYKIITNTGTVFMQGIVALGAASAANTLFNGNGSTHISVNMNGTTTGGLVGTKLSLECVTTGLWEVTGLVLGSGTVATPFAIT